MKVKFLKISEHTSFKNSTVFDLRFVYLARFELNLALQVNVSSGKNAIVQLRIAGSD